MSTRVTLFDLTALGVISLMSLFTGCSKAPTSGAALPWDDVATGSDSHRTWAEKAGQPAFSPKACSSPKKGDGKVYAVEGFVHWDTTTLCRDSACSVVVVNKNLEEGSPVLGPQEGWVRLSAKMDSQVERPKLLNASSRKVLGTNETLGTLEKDSLALSLSDGSKVNNLVRVRVFFEIADVNGGCDLRYLGGLRL